MRRTLAVLLLLPFSLTLAQADDRPIVVGIGNRLSGSLTVRVEGGGLKKKFDALAADLKERGDLKLKVVTRGPANFTVPSTAEGYAADLLQKAILDESRVRHVPTVFRPIETRLEADRLHLATKTLLPGDVEMDLLTVEGESVLPAGAVRPIDLAAVDDPDGTLVRLRWSGSGGLNDEVRYWLPDLLPGGGESIRIEGAEKLPVGEPAFFRVTVSDTEGSPVAGRAVRVADRSAATDANGVATITLPPFKTEDVGEEELFFRVGKARHQRSLTARFRIVPRPRRLVLETDRPVYRPGDDVSIRLLSLDAVNRAARWGEVAEVTVRNPRNRVLATFRGETGKFGEAVNTLPLADGIAEGTYVTEARIGKSVARRSFRVKEIRLPPFEVEVDLDRTVFGDDESIPVLVRARTFTGEPLSGADVEWRMEDRYGHTSLAADGTGEFSIPSGKPGGRLAKFVVTVENAGATEKIERPVLIRRRGKPGFAVTTVPAPLVAGVPGRIRFLLRDALDRPVGGRVTVNIDGQTTTHDVPDRLELDLPVNPARDADGVTLMVRGTVVTGAEVSLDVTLPLVPGGVILGPDVVAPGETAAFDLRTTARTGPVLLDLLIDGRFAGSAAGQLAQGHCRLDLPVAAALGGPARLLARRLDGRWIGSKAVRIGTPDLAVSVAAEPAESSPGETVTVRAEVRGGGVPRSALLDVRGFDRAYLEAVGGFRAPFGNLLDKPGTPSAYYELASVDPVEPLAALEVRALAAVRRVLKESCRLEAAGGRAPWGSPVVLAMGRAGEWTAAVGIYGRDAILVVTEPPVTARPGREGEYPLPLPTDFSFKTGIEGLQPALTILPTGGPEPTLPRNRTRSVTDRGLGQWLRISQRQDGSWRPSRPDRDFSHPYLHPGSTALAILAFLGAGETHRHGRYKKTVKSALRYLKSVQAEDGFFGDPGAPWALLNHAMATTAMCEAYGMTGSPLFRRSAQLGLTRLVAEQRIDGSFGERTFRKGSLVLTGWATMALKSGKSAGLREGPESLGTVRTWLLEREPVATDEERATYPFTLENGTTGPAAITALALIFTGIDPRRGELPEIPLPFPGRQDLHATWWGQLATFQIGGRTWRAYQETTRSMIIDSQIRIGPQRGSWTPGRGMLGRVAATAFATMCLEVYYRYGRVFGVKKAPVGNAAPPRVRRSFSDAAIADLAIPTDSFGRAAIEVALPDNVTTWDFLVGAWDGKGGYAVGRGSVRSTLPISIECELPERLVKGDRLVVPLRVRSRLDAKAEVRVEIEMSPNLEVVDQPRRLFDVPPGDVFALPVVVAAKAAGPATFRVTATGRAHADAWERSIDVRSDRYPFAVAVPVEIGEKTSAAKLLPKDADRLTARLEITTGPTSEARAAFRGLIRRPTGCFEQTAATLYPMIYALTYLEWTGLSDERLSNAARRHLLTGYQRILSFETGNAGFSLYGDAPAKPSLTALGIHLLCDLRRHQAVDEGVVARAAEWLSKHLPSGGANRLYALAALKRTGRKVKLETPKDPYLLALAVVHGLVPEDARDAAKKRFEARPIRTSKHTLFTWGTTSRTALLALRVLALSSLGGDPDVALLVVEELLERREADGGWATTRETVLALRALLAMTGEEPIAGRAIVNGKDSFDLVPGVRRGIALGPWPRDRRIHLAYEGTGRPRAHLVVRGISEHPPRTKTDLDLEVHWEEESVAVGETVTVSITLEANTSIHAPIVVVPIPAGFRPVGRLKPGYRFSLVLVREGRLELYLRSLGIRQVASMEIPLVPTFRGRFTPAPAQAYPYYTPDRKAIEPGPAIEVK